MPPAASTFPNQRLEAERSSRFMQALAMKRRAALGVAAAMALQTGVARPLPELPQTAQGESQTAESEEEDEMREEQDEAQRQAILMMQQQQSMVAKQREATQSAIQQETRASTKKAAKQVAQKTVTRGVRWILEGIMGAIDIGSAGVGIIVTILFQLIDLAWMNVEMVYGSYIAKGKSKFIMPLDWTPLPIPLPAIWLHILVIFVDVLVVIVFTTMMIAQFLALFILVSVMLAPAIAIVYIATEFGTSIADIVRSFLGF